MSRSTGQTFRNADTPVYISTGSSAGRNRGGDDGAGSVRAVPLPDLTSKDAQVPRRGHRHADAVAGLLKDLDGDILSNGQIFAGFELQK